MPSSSELRQTHTYAKLEVSPATYAEIYEKLGAAGYDHAFKEGGAVVMNGIAIVKADQPDQPEKADAAEGRQSRALTDLADERRRQINIEGWTAEHDDRHSTGDMAAAAASYATHGLGVSYRWPWSWQWWKPSTKRRNLIKAGALILAEIERLDRASEKQSDAAE